MSGSNVLQAFAFPAYLICLCFIRMSMVPAI